MTDHPLRPNFFEREDESPDSDFYAEPRLVAHIDEPAMRAARDLYAEVLPARTAILDLMSSYVSHMPPELAWTRLTGVGLNETELRHNEQLSDWVVHDLNHDPTLPFDAGEFDAAVMTVSVQYLTRPVEVFADVARILTPGAPLVVTYSNRMFPTKAVRVWRALDDRERAALIGTYFKYAGAFGDVTVEDRSVVGSGASDPLFAVWAYTATS